MNYNYKPNLLFKVLWGESMGGFLFFSGRLSSIQRGGGVKPEGGKEDETEVGSLFLLPSSQFLFQS